ncbi:unnamed protein product [Adineta ricciae]|uniref:MAM domain-containing protein n=1 Tax=Adineta ricciae TaxID=249248 RepID=A0A814J989_ADIRI|nr:unnamed protein product [Adineta ricciae]
MLSFSGGVTGAMISQTTIGSFNLQTPDAPISDVTSILKPTENGQRCSLPYQIGSNQWDMYFCYTGTCLTSPNVYGNCTIGRYGVVKLGSTAIKSYQIKAGSKGINGVNKQCLIYYYYMSNATQKSITVRKVETNGEDETIDYVTSSPYNGWIKQEVTYNAKASGYNIFFDVVKTVTDSYAPTVAFDELSISQGDCEKSITTEVTTEITRSSATSTLQTSTTSSTTIFTRTTVKTTTTRTASLSQTTVKTTVKTASATKTTFPISTNTPATTSYTSEIPVSTSISENYTTIGEENQPELNNKTLTIVLATVIPTVSIIVIGFVVWMKMSSSASSSIICNYDTHTIATGCLLPVGVRGMLVSDKAANPDAEPPTAPLSDVTSSLMPTENGQNCTLPYKLTPFTWDMYFCNNSYCQTQSDTNAKCQPGKFGYFNFGAPEGPLSFVLNTDTGGTNGTGHQCLSYFYYLPTINGTQQNIKIRIKAKDGDSETIDQVMSSPHNGWNERRVSFVTTKGGYEMYFDLQKTSGKATPLSIIAIDEILVRTGRCEDEPVTLFTSVTTTSTTAMRTTETSSIQTTTTELTTTTTTAFITTEPASTTLLITTTISSTVSTTPAIILTSTTTTTTSTTTTTTTTKTSTTIPTTVSTTRETTTTDVISTKKTTTTKQPTTKPITTTIVRNSTLSLIMPFTTASIEDKKPNGSSKTGLIVGLACGVPVGLIAIVGIGIWIQKTAAGGLLSGMSHPLNNSSNKHEQGSIELEDYITDYSF